MDRMNKASTASLPHSAYSAEWLRAWEPEAAKLAGLSLYQLMQRAGAGAAHTINWCYPFAHHYLILAGHGNNGGDGYVVASLAAAQGKQVTIIECPGQRPLPDEARQARQAWLDAGGSLNGVDDPWPAQVDVIVDGLLGTGLRDAPREPYVGLIHKANAHGAPVVSLDLPSGLNAETGATPSAVIKAAHTVTFIA